MKRRKLGLLSGASFLATSLRPAWAQSVTPDPTLLTTTLTPLGGERAGNADGSIPAWTGGMVSPPMAPNQPVDVKVFTDEQPLYKVDASNMAQYEQLLSPGIQQLMTKFGFYIKVFPTRRTAAAPQYVYENTAKNVTRARLDPAGGRFGFVGAYGGVPFPIIDTSDPLVGGAQLIWNHLTTWLGPQSSAGMVPCSVVSQGRLAMTAGGPSKFVYPYYDPKGSPETFDGYYSKMHVYTQAPAASAGQETLVWHSVNVNKQPDIIWTLVNGQGRVRKAPNEQYDTPNPATNGLNNVDESSCFYGNPLQYDWRYIGKQEMLIPYHNNQVVFTAQNEYMLPKYPNPEITRWEKHRVWVLEATLRSDQRNVYTRRRFYIDEDTWWIILGESYTSDGVMAKAYALLNRVVPSLPGTTELGCLTFNVLTGDYSYQGPLLYEGFSDTMTFAPIPDSVFEPQLMAALASF
jgi:hypothetical protein